MWDLISVSEPETPVRYAHSNTLRVAPGIPHRGAARSVFPATKSVVNTTTNGRIGYPESRWKKSPNSCLMPGSMCRDQSTDRWLLSV